MGEPDGIQLQDRDWELLRGLLEARVMNLEHIRVLYFAGKKDMHRKRVQRLKAAGLVRERSKKVQTDPSVLFLTKPAFRLLQSHGDLAHFPSLSINDLDKRAQVSDRTIDHELEVMDVKAALIAAVGQSDKYKMLEFSVWPTLYEFKACDCDGKQVSVQPDGFIRIEVKEPDGGLSDAAFFLEVDRSKEGNEVLANKAHCYADYRRGGGYALRNSGSSQDHKRHPFRALFVLKTPAKRNYVAARLLLNNPPIGTQVWLTTLSEITSNPLGPIWMRPADYHRATKGTEFDPYMDRDRNLGRWQMARDEFIKKSIIKRELFDERKSQQP